MPILDDIYRETIASLKEAGVENPHLDARILLKHYLGLSDSDLITEGARDVGELPAEFTSALEARLVHKPIAKILGVKEFWGLDFIVDTNVLDPRPDSETLIETVLAHCRDHGGVDKKWTILDLGTGTACLPIALLSELPHARAVATDISPDALRVARRNAATHGVEDRLRFMQGAWLDPILETHESDRGEGLIFDMIISNPPYIPSGDIENLDEDVRNFDPILALDGGKDGLNPYREILKKASQVIHPHGQIFFEYGTNQTNDILRIVEDYGFASPVVVKDLSGCDRVVSMALGAK